MKVVFDVGRVLVRWEPEPVLRDLVGEARWEAFSSEVDFFAWHMAQDAGRSVAEALEDARARYPAWVDVLSGFYPRWGAALPGLITGTVEIKEALEARGVALYAITNFPAERWPETVARYPTLGQFDYVLVSGEVGLVKPDPAIFRLFFERTALAPGDCFFTDDSPANIATATALGMDTHLFTGPEGLRAALSQRGLL